MPDFIICELIFSILSISGLSTLHTGAEGVFAVIGLLYKLQALIKMIQKNLIFCSFVTQFPINIDHKYYGNFRILSNFVGIACKQLHNSESLQIAYS